jgi:hypothetical protein
MNVIPLTYDLSEVPRRRFRAFPAGGNAQPYLRADFKLEICLQDQLEFWMTFDGQRMGSVKATY